MMMKLISDHYSQDNVKSAKVYLDKDTYCVEYIQNTQVVSLRYFPGHSLYMAEDAAENWVNGILRYDHVTADY
jgi:hypothetical protein